MRIIIEKDYEQMSKRAANMVASQMILKPESILGLATGSTPEKMYALLIQANKKGDIDFSNTKTFNLDEYYGLDEKNAQSYHYFMNEKLLSHVNIDPKNINIPNGMATDIESECREYEEKIDQAGGMDLQVLGIGNNGHIGFNEPGDTFIPTTHLIQLNEETIEANARFFKSKEEVPTKAVTMGIQTIMKSKKIILMAAGKGKAEAIYKTIKGNINPQVPASILQVHPDVTIILDEEAASKL